MCGQLLVSIVRMGEERMKKGVWHSDVQDRRDTSRLCLRWFKPKVWNVRSLELRDAKARGMDGEHWRLSTVVEGLHKWYKWQDNCELWLRIFLTRNNGVDSSIAINAAAGNLSGVRLMIGCPVGGSLAPKDAYQELVLDPWVKNANSKENFCTNLLQYICGGSCLF